MILRRNQLITVVPFIGREYTITFDLFFNTYEGKHDHYSILHFTRTGDAANYGDRNPALWTSKDNYIQVASGVDGNHNYWYKDSRQPSKNFINADKPFPLKKWIPIKISQTLVSKKVCLFFCPFPSFFLFRRLPST